MVCNGDNYTANEEPDQLLKTTHILAVDTFTCNFMMAVLNSVGVNVTVMSTLPLAGTIPEGRSDIGI